MTPLPHGTDQLIDATMARALHANACRDHAPAAWVVMWDLPAYPERYAARMATSGAMPSPYLLLADSLAGIRDQLPADLTRSERMPGDPPEGVEVWFAGEALARAGPPLLPGSARQRKAEVIPADGGD